MCVCVCVCVCVCARVCARVCVSMRVRVRVVCKDNGTLINWHIVCTTSECVADTILVTRDYLLMHRSEGNADLLANVKAESDGYTCCHSPSSGFQLPFPCPFVRYPQRRRRGAVGTLQQVGAV